VKVSTECHRVFEEMSQRPLYARCFFAADAFVDLVVDVILDADDKSAADHCAAIAKALVDDQGAAGHETIVPFRAGLLSAMAEPDSVLYALPPSHRATRGFAMAVEQCLKDATEMVPAIHQDRAYKSLPSDVRLDLLAAARRICNVAQNILVRGLVAGSNTDGVQRLWSMGLVPDAHEHIDVMQTNFEESAFKSIKFAVQFDAKLWDKVAKRLGSRA